AVAPEGVFEPAPQEPELAGAAHERGAAPPEPRADPVGRDQPLYGPRRPGMARRGEVEVACEEGGGRLLHEDRATLRHAEQRVEHGPRFALAFQIDLGPAPRRADEHPANGDARADLDASALAVLGALGSLVHGRGREGRPLRRVLDGLEAERGHDARRAHLLDPAAERLDLLEQHLERATRTEPRIE